MKKIYTILTGVALVAALASCSRKEEFKTVPYARLGGTEYTINENGGLLRIPVSVYDNDGGVGSVTFVVKDGTAVEGKDFTELINAKYRKKFKSKKKYQKLIF